MENNYRLKGYRSVHQNVQGVNMNNVKAIVLAAICVFSLLGCGDTSGGNKENSVKSSNADLSALTVSVGSLTPGFSSDVTGYLVSVGAAVTEIIVTGTVQDSKAVLSANSGTVLALSEGTTSVHIDVTAEDGTKKTYTVNVNRGADTTAPNLSGFTLSPSSVDTTNGDQTVTGTIIVEEATGMGDTPVVVFAAPDKTSFSPVVKKNEAESSGFKFVYDWTMTVKKGSDGGIWTLSSITLNDVLQNSKTYRTEDITTLGFPSSFTDNALIREPASQGLTGFTISPLSVDTTNADQTVGGTITVEESTGMGDAPFVVFTSPYATNAYPTVKKNDSASFGSKYVYDWTMTIKSGFNGGTWNLSSIKVVDSLKNSKVYMSADIKTLGFPVTFVDNAPVKETTPPSLTGFTIMPSSVDTTNADQTVSGTITVEESTGMGDAPFVIFTSPYKTNAYPTVKKNETASLGSKYVYDWTMTVKSGFNGGTWNLFYIKAEDSLKNSKMYMSADIKTLGFPVSFIDTKE